MIEEQDISRGTIGQSVEAILNSLPQSKACLAEIIADSGIDITIREDAGTIFAYKWQLESLPILETFLHESEAIAWIIDMLKEECHVELYD